MDKQKYYVSVQSGSIHSNPEEASYEFEVIATPKEIAQLRELFEEHMEVDQAGFIRAHLPGIPYHQDEENDQYDELLQNIYQMVHKLGTQETREHIEQMGLNTFDNMK